MPELVEYLGYGVVLPAAIALTMSLMAARILPVSSVVRHAAVVGFAAAFFVGYVLLPDWAELVPSRHWHWLPYLAIAAGVIGPVGRADGVFTAERWLLHALLSIVVAWLIVPTWASLEPPRSAYVPALACYLVLLMSLLEPLAERVPTVRFSMLLSLSAFTVALCVAVFVSVNYGRLAGLAGSALAGLALANWISRRDWNVAGLAPAYAGVLGGVAFVGAIEPQEPLLGNLLVPAAPLTLWFSMVGPLKSLSGRKQLLTQGGLVLATLIAAAVVVQIESTSGGGDALE